MAATIAIKNMVCPRCVKTVRRIFEHHGAIPEHVELGKVVVKEFPGDATLDALRKDLELEGFAILDDKRKRIVDQIKTLIVDAIHHTPSRKPESQSYSQFLAHQLNMDYSALSKLFSSIEGRTIERFVIAQKIEKVKELLIYNELTLSEIAYQLDYSSVQHLSAQFRKETGFSPSTFKKEKTNDRKPLDRV